MSRIVHPDDFASQQNLLSGILTKHAADGNSSPLKPYFTQQNITVTTLTANAGLAATHENSRALFSRQSENWRQLRNNIIALPFATLKAMVQFLKSFYRGNEQAIGDWGVTVNGKKIVYPVKFLEMVTLFNTFKAKHDSLGANSPLIVYVTEHAIDLNLLSAKLQTAVTYHNSFQQARMNAENETELRNNLWNPIMIVIMGIATYLMKLFNNNPKKLGLWSFVVDDSPRKPVVQTSKVKPADKLTIKTVLIGSTLTNVGDVELHVYKGKTTLGTPSILPAGEKLGMVKGYSTITAVNPSSLETGVLTVMRNK